jgi:F-type H+-transporting ATPase subunit gamma
MASLKDLRVRIKSVKSTRKITSAMKMVAASKLRRAQEQAEAGRPYAERMGRMLASLAGNVAGKPGAPKLLVGTGRKEVHLVVVVTADRGLCGAFNTNSIRLARTTIDDLLKAGKTVRIITVGSKAFDQMRRIHEPRIVGRFSGMAKPRPTFAAAAQVADKILELFDAHAFDVCTLVYNRFKSVISQPATAQTLIPFTLDTEDVVEARKAEKKAGPQAVYEFEPSEEAILADLLPRNLSVQLYKALLDSNAGEHAARMTAMDNATRNAGDMINNLTLTYNRTRQAVITTELIEIISGAAAL